jgi:hypothetical protein
MSLELERNKLAITGSCSSDGSSYEVSQNRYLIELLLPSTKQERDATTLERFLYDSCEQDAISYVTEITRPSKKFTSRTKHVHTLALSLTRGNLGVFLVSGFINPLRNLVEE